MALFWPQKVWAPGWTNLQLVVAAAGLNTMVKFGFAGLLFMRQRRPHLDDVNVIMLPLTINAQLVGASNVLLSFVGKANANYALERTFNLTPSVAWVPLSTNATDGSGVLALTAAAGVTTNNFWHVRLVPIVNSHL